MLFRPSASDRAKALGEFEAAFLEAEHLVYAHIVRGWDVAGALALGLLPVDWPARPAYQPDEHHSHQRSAFDHVLAPNAFGTMLLRPGFADRLPEGGDRRDHLERARGTLEPLLYAPSHLRRSGSRAVSSHRSGAAKAETPRRACRGQRQSTSLRAP